MRTLRWAAWMLALSPVQLAAEDAAPAAPAGTGKILYEFWSGIEGTDLNVLKNHPKFPDSPTGTQELTSFDGPVERDDNYGARIRGYVHPPTTGEYVFYFASDDQGELSLSTDEDPVNVARIALVPEWTDPQEWEKFPEQKSQPVKLEAGKKYYIEGLVKEGEGGDHISAGWVLPGGAKEMPIPGKRLSPYVKPVLPPDAAGGTGKILYEAYASIEGGTIADLTGHANFPDKPSSKQELTTFEAPVDSDDNFGARIRGFVHAPQTGTYVFWLASDDNGELRLSTDEDPKNAGVIATVPEWTGPNEWNKFPEQKSKPVKLEAGKKYYIEARMKEGEGGDNLSVGWAIPGGRLERPIAGKWLSPPAAK
jgi:hypothetical protein